MVVDTVLDSDLTQAFFCAAWESQPRSIRLAVLLDEPGRRGVALEQDYFGFRTASKQVGGGYGLAAPIWNEEKPEGACFRNEPCRKQWQRTEKESMIEAALGGFRN